MLSLPQSVKIYLATKPVDMRKQIDGLMSIVRNTWKEAPYTGHLFVFVSRKRNRVKIILFDHGGFVVLYKRLERGYFRVPLPGNGEKRMQLESSELAMLLRGIDYTAGCAARLHGFRRAPLRCLAHRMRCQRYLQVPSLPHRLNRWPRRSAMATSVAPLKNCLTGGSTYVQRLPWSTRTKRPLNHGKLSATSLCYALASLSASLSGCRRRMPGWYICWKPTSVLKDWNIWSNS